MILYLLSHSLLIKEGYLATASEGGTVYHYTRDREGRTLSRSAWGRTLYEDRYDRDGKLQESADGMGKISYCYDRAGRLTRVSSNSGAGAGYRYDRNGRQTQVLYANGMKTSYRYDSRSRMTGMETLMPGGELLYRLSCTYDRAGNRDGREEQYRDAVSGSIHTAVTSYAYDSMGRLTGETLDGETACYSYDHAGNRLTRTGAGRTEHYRYNSRNQLTELDSTAGTVRYEYDPAGSLTAEVHTAQGGSAAERTGYTYDAYNRNTSVCGAGYVQQNHYDAEGLRYAVTENGETTNFVYRNGMPVSELDADKNPVRGYVLENEYISQVNGTTFGYYLNDGQESVRYLTGSDGSIRNHYRYSAFGETITAEETVSNRLRYNGQMADGLTGLYYLRARYYNASLGRFTQEDVIYNDGLNLYAYCNNNPVMYADPSGYAGGSVKQKTCGPKESGTSSYGAYSTKIDPKVTVVEKQELPSWLIDTYKDGQYRTVVTNEEITVYRAFGYNAEAGGAFATSNPAINRVQTKVDSAILPEWKNTLRYEAEIVIPKGTTLNIGHVGEQYTMSGARLAGDADQFLLPQNWDLNWIKSIRTIKP